MQSNENLHKVNPELFKGQTPYKLEGKSYYAYLDSVEKIYGKTHLRLDCIIKSIADSLEINSESIMNLPSIVIEISGDSKRINELFNNKELYNLESKWMKITTSISKSELQQQQYFNFIQISNPNEINNYDLSEVVLFENLDPTSQAKINEIIFTTTIKESSESEVISFLNKLQFKDLCYLNVYNVGQGNCSAIVTSDNIPQIYFDVGGGSGANKSSYPPSFKICHTEKPQVILSHWDVDHIQTAVFDPRILNSVWLVPKHKSISATAMHIAQTLINRGNLICWNNNLTYIDFSNHRIVKCTGKSGNKNNSGLSLFFSPTPKQFILLPGDATFRYIPDHPNGELIGLVASHHGAKASIRGMPAASKGAMLVYSFGNGNTHGHAHTLARKAYIKNGWGKGLETRNGNITIRSGGTMLQTPCNSRGCTLNVVQQF